MECYCNCIIREFKIFFHFAKFDNFKDSQFYFSRTEVLQIAQLLTLVIFASVSLKSENLRGL